MRLLALLTAAQSRTGFLTDEDLRAVAAEGKVPLHRVQQLVSFYPHFRRTPPKRVTLAVCRDMSCWLAGGEACANRLKALASDDVEVKAVSCIGRCDRGPAGLLNDHPVELKDEAKVANWVKNPEAVESVVFPVSRKWSSDPYANSDEWYSTALSNPDTDQVLAELKASGLRGMGGAGFPTGVKWEAVRKDARTPKYVICNADESEPGTFKDALVLRELPHLVIEGMAIAAKTVGSQKGILFLRHEYEAEKHAFEAALRDSSRRGILGPDFDLEIFVSPGGYILGEETALLECLEDKRGEPRNKPPFPVSHGLHGMPTLINNVETFANVPGIVKNGGAWWSALGTPGCPGPKFIAVSGHVEKPGVYQVPLGTTVRELIAQAGGVSGGRKLLAFAPGGASSNFLPADQVDVKLSFNDLAKAGSMLGSGALVVVAEGTDLLALGTNVVRFFRNESCGKCVPCRVGSEKAVHILDDVLSGRQPRTALDVLPELGETLSLTSICGLGQVALNPALSAMKLLERP